jgi:TPR repeat protein
MNNYCGAQRAICFAALATTMAVSVAFATPDAENKEAAKSGTAVAAAQTETPKGAAEKPVADQTAAKTAAVQSAVTPSQSAEDLYKEGRKAIIDGDLIAAMPLFKKAADAGYAPAQVSVAELFLASDYFVESVEYFRKAAEQGNADGQFGLATSYIEGKGIPKDLKQALEWFTKAAEQNHAPAIDALSAAYANGGLGLSAEERNSDKAFHWIEAAAKHENLLAMRALVYAYKTGAFGASVNPSQAEAWDAKVKEIEAKYKTKKKKGKQ